MGLIGDRVTTGNFRLRFFLIFFSGIVALGSVLYWRSQLLWSQEYVEFPQDYPKVRQKHLPLKTLEPNE
jgi:hypothetical protein